jgi:hypothetical protein
VKLKTFSPGDQSIYAIAAGNRKADLAHDAAVAHALFQAINSPEVQMTMNHQYIIDRADELMAEWGYREE